MRPLDSEPGLRIPNMFDGAVEGTFKALYVQGEDIAQSDPNTHHVQAALASARILCIVQDLFMNDTVKFRIRLLAGYVVSRKGRDLHQRGAAHQPGQARSWRRETASRNGRSSATSPLRWATTMHYENSERDQDEIARDDTYFRRGLVRRLDALGSVQWPCNEKAAPLGTPIMHIGKFVRGKGSFRRGPRSSRQTSGRTAAIRSSSRPAASCPSTTSAPRREGRRTSVWHPEDLLEIHPYDAEERGVVEGGWVALASRSGETELRAHHRAWPQGVVYTTFHHPVTGANVVTTEHSDWATNCPEYKVTAVQVRARSARRYQPGVPECPVGPGGLRCPRVALRSTR